MSNNPNFNVNYRHEYGSLFLSAVRRKQNEILDLILNHPNFDIESIKTEKHAMTIFAENNNIDALKTLERKIKHFSDKPWFDDFLEIAYKESYDFIKYFFERGNLSSNSVFEGGNTLLLKAILKEDIEFVKRILEQEDDIDHANDCGTTPLILATRIENIEIVKLIWEKRPSLDLEDKYRKTAEDYAVRYYNKELIALFKEFRRIEIEEAYPSEQSEATSGSESDESNERSE